MNIKKIDNTKLKLILNNDSVFEGKIDKVFLEDDYYNQDYFNYIKKYSYELEEFRGKNYEESDLTLVRTTDIFPDSDGRVRTIANSKCFDECENLFYLEDKKLISPIYSMYRSSIHFCLNGLVGNHSMGNFSNRDYFIFDDYENHKEDDLLSFTEVDTYFDGDIMLSDNCSICMSQNQYNKLLEKQENIKALERYKTIFIYDLKDDFEEEQKDEYFDLWIEKALCKYCLIELGKPCFSMSSSYYTGNSNIESTTAMTEFINNYAETNNLPRTSHFFSERCMDDLKRLTEEKNESMINHYKYVVLKSNASKELKDEMLSFIGNNYINSFIFEKNNHLKETKTIQKYIEKVKEFIDVIGIDEYNMLTEQYNKDYEMVREEELDKSYSR